MPEKLLGLADTNTTYSEVTQSKSGLMSASDKQKLDGISTGATNTSVYLLWTNWNPYSGIGDYTVNLDLSSYKILLIDFVNEAGVANYVNGQWFPIGASCCAYGSGHNNGAVLRRQFDTSYGGVTFHGASYDNGSWNSNLLIPWHIYGVK